MKTLPREPWRGGQICGEQLSHTTWTSRESYCGEFKKLGSPVCEVHDRELREDTEDGLLPKFAEGNALGLVLKEIPGYGWGVHDQHGSVVGSNHLHDFPLKEIYGFTLSWETEDPDKPEPATPEEIAAWEAS